MNKIPSHKNRAEGISRRNFLATTATVTSFMALPAHVLGLEGATSPNNKLNIAGIGVGGQGGNDIDEVSGENIVALCDVDKDHAAHTFKKYPNAKQYTDFREMLDKDKSIDAVVVGTPDHLHAYVSVTSLKHGKHVYCEKPLTRTVHEARRVAQVARESKRATQMGNQGMAFDGNRLINEWLWDGAIGPVTDRPTEARCHSGGRKALIAPPTPPPCRTH
jgi:predicted dehydrogenase